MFEEDYTVGELEAALLKLIPASDAEPWDRTGLLVGDPNQMVTSVLLCLDPTVEAVRHAVKVGANVIITHHPAFLDAPTAFGPLSPAIPDSGSVVWEAARYDIALMNFHTALDVHPLAAQVLPAKLGLKFEGILDVVRANPDRGYGQICSVVQEKPIEGPYTLDDVAAAVYVSLGRKPRVWGDINRPVSKVVTATGSGGDLADACLEAGVDVLCCGEIKYHAALGAAQKGLAIVDMGHDVSELPLVDVLLELCKQAGCPVEDLHIFEQSHNWR